MNEQNHNVLAVEDEEAARSMLALSLKLAGYNVHKRVMVWKPWAR